MSGISRSRLLITASGKMCKRTIQREFLAWMKGNVGDQRGKVLKLQKALEPFSYWSLVMWQSYQKQTAPPEAKPYIMEE